MVGSSGKRGGAGAYKSHIRPYPMVCTMCGNEFLTKRPHAKTCSIKCRVALHRRDKKAMDAGGQSDRFIIINTKAGRIEQRVMWS